MRTVRRSYLLAAIVALPVVLRAQQPRPPQDRVAGVWLGAVNVGAASVRLQLTIRRDSAGALDGIMKVIDQGGVEIPVSVTAPSDSMTFAIPSQGISYAGAFSPAGDSIRGTFFKSRSFLLTFVRANAPVSDRRPQDSVPPFPYRTQEVTIQSVPGVTLAGTLDVPPGKGPFPVVVFVTGSGPQHRDEAIVGHRPFLLIADATEKTVSPQVLGSSRPGSISAFNRSS